MSKDLKTATPVQSSAPASGTSSALLDPGSNAAGIAGLGTGMTILGGATSFLKALDSEQTIEERALSGVDTLGSLLSLAPKKGLGTLGGALGVGTNLTRTLDSDRGDVERVDSGIDTLLNAASLFPGAKLHTMAGQGGTILGRTGRHMAASEDARPLTAKYGVDFEGKNNRMTDAMTDGLAGMQDWANRGTEVRDTAYAGANWMEDHGVLPGMAPMLRKGGYHVENGLDAARESMFAVGAGALSIPTQLEDAKTAAVNYTSKKVVQGAEWVGQKGTQAVTAASDGIDKVSSPETQQRIAEGFDAAGDTTHDVISGAAGGVADHVRNVPLVGDELGDRIAGAGSTVAGAADTLVDNAGHTINNATSAVADMRDGVVNETMSAVVDPKKWAANKANKLKSKGKDLAGSMVHPSLKRLFGAN